MQPTGTKSAGRGDELDDPDMRGIRSTRMAGGGAGIGFSASDENLGEVNPPLRWDSHPPAPREPRADRWPRRRPIRAS